jgi:phage shock protein PspC (stress-responsive transcriptional regulator)
MKKTFTINISGNIFHIEEDAYERLQGYLLKLKNHFGNEAEGREIVSDIESRIGELFQEKSKGENKVITQEWVDDVIAIMGTPEDFIQQEGEEEPVIMAVKGKKRLYRDPDSRVIAGVCSGLGAYFKVDPVVIRVLFVLLLLTTGVGFLAYLVLWIAVPKAQSTAQRLEMRGEEVNISNIERTVRVDVPETKDGLPNQEASPAAIKKEKTSRENDVFSDIARGIIKICAIALGIFLILIGFFGLLAFLSTLIVGQSFLSDWPLVWSPDFQISSMLGHFVTPGTLAWGMICISLLAGIPLLAMLFIGTKLVFKYKSNNSAIGLGMVGVWLLALIGLLVVATKEVGNYKNQTSLSNSETLYPQPGKALQLSLLKDQFENNNEVDLDINHFKEVQIDGKFILLGEPRLDIEKSSSNDCVIIVKKHSKGSTTSECNENIRKIIYRYQVTDSSLTFDPWFMVGEKQNWRDQKVNITLKIPEGTSIFLNDNMDRIIYDIENVSNTWDHDMIGKTWVMTADGLAMKDSLEVHVQ